MSRKQDREILVEAEEGGVGRVSDLTGTLKGMTVLTCAIFIIAEMAGSGVLALPKSVSESGWTGMALLIGCCLLSLYCGIILGNCWTIVREQNPAYRGHVRDPYPLIGAQAAGKLGKYVVEFCVLVTLFGVCVVFLLLASEQISSLINTKIGSFTPKNEFRVWILICSACLLPFTWLATPKDLWPFAVGATFCTIVACILMIARSGMHIATYGASHKDGGITADSFFSAFGTIAFSFGGASLFPTFQTDMKEPLKFPQAASLGFAFVLLLYVPMVTVPYIAFGRHIDDNLLQTLSDLPGNGHALVEASKVLITFHLLFAFVITLNPICQQIEEYLKMNHGK